MSTRSAIGYQVISGAVTAVYCHWDGYPDHQLPILNAHYSKLPAVRSLIRPGSISHLRTEQLWNSEFRRDQNGNGCFKPSRPPQPLYYHERGDGLWNDHGRIQYWNPPVRKRSLAAAKRYWHEQDCEFLYVFHPDQQWLHYRL